MRDYLEQYTEAQNEVKKQLLHWCFTVHSYSGILNN